MREIKNILNRTVPQSQRRAFILMEGWMPPLVAFITYLKDLREILPEKTMIHLGLVGQTGAFRITPLTPQDLAIWRKKYRPQRPLSACLLSALLTGHFDDTGIRHTGTSKRRQNPSVLSTLAEEDG